MFNYLSKFYNLFAYHVKYDLDENNNIIKTESNAKLGSAKFNYILTCILILTFVVLFINMLLEDINKTKNQKIFLRNFNVIEICIENNMWTECLGYPEQKRVRVYYDKNDTLGTLFIKED